MSPDPRPPPNPTLDAFRLDGRVALITGAGQGIGAATAIAMADVGADVALTARTEADLEAVAEAVRARGRRALVLPGDVNDLDHLAAVVAATTDGARPPRRAGQQRRRLGVASRSSTRPSPQLESSFHFNVSAAFELSRLAVPHDARRRRRRRSSTSARSPAATPAGARSPTASPRPSVAQLTRLMAADLAPRVRVNGVLPGAVETAALRR